MSRKVVNDAVAYIRGLAALRGRATTAERYRSAFQVDPEEFDRRFAAYLADRFR